MAVHLYTRYIKILRLVLPTIALISLIGLIAWPFWREHQQNIKAAKELSRTAAAHTQAAAATPANAPLQVEHPDYQGVDNQGRPYHITATRVEQDLNAKAPITLIEPIATLEIRPATPDAPARVLTLTALHGLYDAQALTLDLRGKVVLHTSEGYDIAADDLVADLGRFYAMTTTPVNGQGPRGTLQGQNLYIADKGALVVLKGPSRLVLQPADPSSQPSASP